MNIIIVINRYWLIYFLVILMHITNTFITMVSKNQNKF